MKLYQKLPQVKSSLSHLNSNGLVLHGHDAHNMSSNKLPNTIDDSMQIYKIQSNQQKSLSPV